MRIKCVLLLLTLVMLTGCNFASSEYTIKEVTYNYVYNGHNYELPNIAVYNLDNETVMRTINNVLKNVIGEILEVSNYNESWGPMLTELSVSVQHQSRDYISVLFELHNSSTEDDYRTGYGRIGVTIDLRTGKRLFLDDFINSPERLYEEIQAYDSPYSEAYYIGNFEDAKEIYASASISEIEFIEETRLSDPLANDFALEYAFRRPTFYLTQDEIVVIRQPVDIYDVHIPL